MNISAKGLALIKESEGFRADEYLDVAGKPTIGYGHLIKKGEDFSKGVTEEQATGLLQKDVAWAEEAVAAHVLVPLNQNQFDALVDFTFNLGAGRLKESTLLKLVNEGKMEQAAEQFARWVRAGGKVQPGLVTRRQKERDLWLA
jgi:GH24 family phage-related lysozyme (muramidase)